MSDDRPPVYLEDGKVVYRASALGFCTSALAWARLEVEPNRPSERMLQAFAEGSAMEDTLIEAVRDENTGMFLYSPTELRKRGFRVPEGQVEVEIAWGNNVVRCHPDAIGFAPELDSDVAVEVKFLGPDLYRKVTKDLSSQKSYEWQVSVEMHATGMPLLYGIGQKDPETRELVEESLVCKLITEPPHSLLEIKKRVAEVEKMALAGEVADCEYKMFPCPYHFLHRADDPLWAEVEVEELDREREDALVAVIDRYWRGLQMEKKGREMSSEARDAYRELTREWEAVGGQKWKAGGFEVTHVAKQNVRTDWSRLCQDAQIPEETIEKYRTSTSTVYPQVKRLERLKGKGKEKGSTSGGNDSTSE